jgi:hypothetical protein
MHEKYRLRCPLASSPGTVQIYLRSNLAILFEFAGTASGALDRSVEDAALCAEHHYMTRHYVHSNVASGDARHRISEETVNGKP